MAEKEKRTVTVLGASGHQGGAVARQLIKKGFKVRAVTRKPDSTAAKELEKLGAEIFSADIGNEADARRALDGSWGAFSVLTMAEAGVKWEEEQGKMFAETARKAGVEHFVYSSVASADSATGIPHFESKWHIEEKVRSLNFAYYTIIRPVSFMENILNPRTWAGIESGRLIMGLRPDQKQQLISVQDIGKYGALPFEQPDRTNRQEIEIAGDEKTVNEMALILEKTLGREITAAPVSLDEIRASMPDFARMIEWMDNTGYKVDIRGLEGRYGIKPVTFEQFCRGLKVSARAK